LTATTSNGDLTLAAITVTGTLTARSSFGALKLTQAGAAAYDLHTGNGKIVVDGAGGAFRASSDFGDIEVSNGDKATLDLQTSNGSIRYAGSLGEGPHKLKSEFGAISLTLPAEAALTLDLTTEFGKIRSAFPLTVSGDLDEKHWRGEVNGGGLALTASTGNGDISLEILNP
jgi:DUF4097 and DUF4098 domain-containing protein YvlB